VVQDPVNAAGVETPVREGKFISGGDSVLERAHALHAGGHDCRTFSSDYTFELTSAVTTERGYALEWTMRGTHDHATEQLAATGRRFELRGASVGSLRTGKIVENRDYYNFADFLTQVGLMPDPAGVVASSA
jgi:hypothetical protein